jgi:molybdopterin converting factor small subunit
LDPQRVEVLLFGAEAKAVGRASVLVQVPPGASCQTIRHHLAEAYATLLPFLKSARFAVNSEFVPLDTIVRDGDEVALIGMVSGG